MKKILSLVLLFIVSFIGFVVYLAPAAVVLDYAKPYLGKSVQLSGVSGTVWQGNAQQASVNSQTLNNITWQLKPLNLFTGTIAVDIKFGKLRGFDSPYGKGSIALPLGFDMVTLDTVSVRVPADMVMKNAQLPMPLPAKGNIKLAVKNANILLQDKSKLCTEFSGQVETHNLSVQGLQGWIEFDTIEGALGCSSGAISIAVTKANQLGLQLEAEYGKLGVKVSGFVKPDSSMPKQLHDAVKFLGRPDGTGRYPLKF